MSIAAPDKKFNAEEADNFEDVRQALALPALPALQPRPC
jgi:hypothetical protein